MVYFLFISHSIMIVDDISTHAATTAATNAFRCSNLHFYLLLFFFFLSNVGFRLQFTQKTTQKLQRIGGLFQTKLDNYILQLSHEH